MLDLPCQHRSIKAASGVFQCDIYGQCTLEPEHSRLRSCSHCSDRMTEGVKIADDEMKQGLGDRVKQALSIVGITNERVEQWLGHPCRCDERQEKLNQLGFWATRILKGKIDRAKEYLEKLME